MRSPRTRRRSSPAWSAPPAPARSTSARVHGLAGRARARDRADRVGARHPCARRRRGLPFEISRLLRPRNRAAVRRRCRRGRRLLDRRGAGPYRSGRAPRRSRRRRSDPPAPRRAYSDAAAGDVQGRGRAAVGGDGRGARARAAGSRRRRRPVRLSPGEFGGSSAPSANGSGYRPTASSTTSIDSRMRRPRRCRSRCRSRSPRGDCVGAIGCYLPRSGAGSTWGATTLKWGSPSPVQPSAGGARSTAGRSRSGPRARTACPRRLGDRRAARSAAGRRRRTRPGSSRRAVR